MSPTTTLGTTTLGAKPKQIYEYSKTNFKILSLVHFSPKTWLSITS
jgi:hypothetical protein